MNDVSKATVEVLPVGKKILGIFPSSLAVPAYAVFTAANIRHPNSRSAYLETIYWCVSREAREKMVNEDKVFRRGSQQLFTAEHVWWMHVIHESLRSQRAIEEGKQNSHDLLRQKAECEHWTWRDFASALKLQKETLNRFYRSTQLILDKGNQIHEQRKSTQRIPSPDSSGKSPRRSTSRRRSPRAGSGTGSTLDGIANFF